MPDVKGDNFCIEIPTNSLRINYFKRGKVLNRKKYFVYHFHNNLSYFKRFFIGSSSL